MLEFRNVRLRRGAQVLIDAASFTVYRGDKVGIVGRNGCGKSSLLALLRGELPVDGGDYTAPRDLHFVAVLQELPATEATVQEYIRCGDTRLLAIENALAAARAVHDGMREAALLGDYESSGGYSAAARAAELADGLGFAPAHLRTPLRSLSGGLQMRANLARALMARADVLMLDEPTNHLDLDAVLWLENWLRRFVGTLLLVSHDREFLDGVVGRIVHIEAGKLGAYEGNYESFQRQYSAQIERTAALAARQTREVARLQGFIARFRAQASKAKQVQSRIKSLAKLETFAERISAETFEWQFAGAKKLPQPLVALYKVGTAYGAQRVFDGATISVSPGDRIGVLGRNGAGKTTLMRVIAGTLATTQGERTAAADLAVGSFAQLEVDRLRAVDSALLALNRRLEEIGALQEWSEQQRRDHLGQFGFRGERVFEPVGTFSGGERARLALSILVAERPNLLLLDEPTNHLDSDMRHSLAMALQEFAGAVITVSHDRGLLQSVCDEFWLVADGSVSRFDGDLTDYANWLERRGNAASRDTSATAPAAGDRREQRRQQAAARNLLSPLRSDIRALELSLERLGRERGQLEAQLADPQLYASDASGSARELASRHAAVLQEVQHLEARWLERSEELERAMMATESA
jgi:ATP-binding cassette subfamily F protein 3